MVFEGFEIKEKLKVLKFYRLETISILFGYQRQEEAFAVCYMNQTFQQYSNFFFREMLEQSSVELENTISDLEEKNDNVEDEGR